MSGSAYARKRPGLFASLLGIGIIAAAIVLGLAYMRKARNNPLSEDAVIMANTVNIASTVPGRIVEINVKENGRVKRGDLLFKVDPEPFRLLVEQTAADLKIAEAARETQQRTIAAEQSNAQIANQQIQRAKSNLALAEETLKRLTALLPKGYVTRQQVDDARTLRDDAQVSLNQAFKQAKAADSLVNTIDGAQALVEARQAALALAQRNLDNTDVLAPHDGLVVGLTIATGQIIIPGQSVFTLIDTENWYASASFMETELDRIAIGDCATVHILANRSIPIQGRVESIGWGVTSEELINIPRNLPYVPKSLNWVRIEQRFPVRIKLNNPPEDLTRVGGSAVVMVKHGKQC
ncbi:multidrug transporter subunit MdtN [Pseudochelatococcus sp. G4_1912]|uniref:multidrug transporter subunit MdtN n=1 Tax=Pseudochelatococcus sp. G4_1912 TaxID=3114288 RepID=UPI0039C6E6EB